MPQSKYLFQWFTETLQIASKTIKGKSTALSSEDKVTICEHLDKGPSKSDLACECKIIVFIYFMYICLII